MKKKNTFKLQKIESEETFENYSLSPRNPETAENMEEDTINREHNSKKKKRNRPIELNIKTKSS